MVTAAGSFLFGGNGPATPHQRTSRYQGTRCRGQSDTESHQDGTAGTILTAGPRPATPRLTDSHVEVSPDGRVGTFILGRPRLLPGHRLADGQRSRPTPSFGMSPFGMSLKTDTQHAPCHCPKRTTHRRPSHMALRPAARRARTRTDHSYGMRQGWPGDLNVRHLPRSPTLFLEINVVTPSAKSRTS
jgi:hypothetical protein